MHPAGPGKGKAADPADISTFEPLEPGTAPAGSTRHPPFAVDMVVGSYRLIRLLGRGGFGDVWEAESLTTSRRLALKILTETRSPSLDLLERFKREGRLAGSLNHPRCVFAFGAEEIDGYPAITMELMSGGTLQDRLNKDGPIPAREAVDLILDVIEGLEAAQQAGILHRDIKPSNCFVDQAGRCKIGDFGISKSLQAPIDLTLTGAFIGTPTYASPEQVRGRELDFRSDIYSAGATLYALITGQPPFRGERAGEMLARIVGEEPIPFSTYPVDVPNGLQRTIRRAMSKDRDKRFKNYSELRAALLPFSSGGLTTGSVFARFVAYEIDSWLLALANLAISYLGIPTLRWGVPLFLYFAFTERAWGRSVGKYLLGLRVTTTAGAPLTMRHAIVRTAIWNGFALVPALAQMVLPSGRYLTFLGLLPFAFVTARARNGYSGVHEVLSGTRVMSLRAREARHVPVRQLPVAGRGVSESEKRGPYVVVGTMWQSGSDALLSGQDELLGRPVWILDHAADTSLPIDALTEVRAGRLRWLQGSRDGSRHWDAYEAPAGTGLAEWVSEKGSLSWEEMRAILFGVATELDAGIEPARGAALQNPTGPRSLSVADVWIDSHGAARLLGFPAPRSDGRPARGFTTFPPQEWASFLHDMTYFSLTGHLGPVTGSRTMPRVPIPGHARAVVNLICGASGKVASPLEIVEELRRTAHRPARLSKVRRTGPAAVLVSLYLLPLIGALLSFSLLASPAISSWMKDLTNAPRYQTELRRIPNENVESNRRKADALRKVMANSYTQAQLTREGRQLLSTFGPDVRRDLEAAAQRYPRLSEGEVAEARRDLPPLPSTATVLWQVAPAMIGLPWLASGILALLMAAILGTGPVFRMFQMSLQTRDGRKAGRIRCLVRAAVAWSPAVPLGLWFVAPVLGLRFVRVEPSLTLLLAMIAIALVGLIYNLIRPERGIPDIVAGTYLMPA